MGGLGPSFHTHLAESGGRGGAALLAPFERLAGVASCSYATAKKVVKLSRTPAEAGVLLSGRRVGWRPVAHSMPSPQQEGLPCCVGAAAETHSFDPGQVCVRSEAEYADVLESLVRGRLSDDRRRELRNASTEMERIAVRRCYRGLLAAWSRHRRSALRRSCCRPQGGRGGSASAGLQRRKSGRDAQGGAATMPGRAQSFAQGVAPLTLGNTSHKAILVMMSIMIERVAPEVVHPSQRGFVRRRDLLTNAAELEGAVTSFLRYGGVLGRRVALHPLSCRAARCPLGARDVLGTWPSRRPPSYASSTRRRGWRGCTRQPLAAWAGCSARRCSAASRVLLCLRYAFRMAPFLPRSRRSKSRVSACRPPRSLVAVPRRAASFAEQWAATTPVSSCSVLWWWASLRASPLGDRRFG